MTVCTVHVCGSVKRACVCAPLNTTPRLLSTASPVPLKQRVFPLLTIMTASNIPECGSAKRACVCEAPLRITNNPLHNLDTFQLGMTLLTLQLDSLHQRVWQRKTRLRMRPMTHNVTIAPCDNPNTNPATYYCDDEHHPREWQGKTRVRMRSTPGNNKVTSLYNSAPHCCGRDFLPRSR